MKYRAEILSMDKLWNYWIFDIKKISGFDWLQLFSVIDSRLKYETGLINTEHSKKRLYGYV